MEVLLQISQQDLPLGILDGAELTLSAEQLDILDGNVDSLVNVSVLVQAWHSVKQAIPTNVKSISTTDSILAISLDQFKIF